MMTYLCDPLHNPFAAVFSGANGTGTLLLLHRSSAVFLRPSRCGGLSPMSTSLTPGSARYRCGPKSVSFWTIPCVPLRTGALLPLHRWNAVFNGPSRNGGLSPTSRTIGSSGLHIDFMSISVGAVIRAPSRKDTLLPRSSSTTRGDGPTCNGGLFPTSTSVNA
ncbi:MAG: hypothetical protein WCW40_00260 [Bacteroidota bacterium]